ncbi:glycosyl transferase [Colletotrichum kahawae]|uniref:Glycosyl transferase n=1 Tax=Colletotrichum kahawae TaxID=34407 RepID=A0AAE0CY05_COLKA|nr:glycosyl transferase [Colletotrichum kahawae]
MKMRPHTNLNFTSKILRGKDEIPNQVHFVWALYDVDSELEFAFEQYLSMYSAWFYLKPHTIYLHTNAKEAQIDRARNGSSGKWASRIFSIPGLQVKWMEAPHETNLGVELAYKEHISDFMRVKAVHEYGGVYIDFDVQVLQDVAALRKSGFTAVGGRQIDQNLNSGTFMSKKGGEVLILDSKAFAPVGWNPEDAIQLFGVQNETLELDIDAGLTASADDGEVEIDWTVNNSSWPLDWKATYFLHAFTPDWNVIPINGFQGITPQYVLSRQSNYALATYPVVKDMYINGLVTMEDGEYQRQGNDQAES